ncbi:unnamed protein product, partial [Porites evermanni]
SFSGSKSLSLESLLSLSGSLVQKDMNKVVRKILFMEKSAEFTEIFDANYPKNQSNSSKAYGLEEATKDRGNNNKKHKDGLQ